MNDQEKTREQLIRELKEVRERNVELEVRETSANRWVELLQEANSLKEDLLGPSGLEEKLKHITDGLVEIFGADFARIWITKPGDLCDSDCVHAKVTEGPHICRYRDRCLHLMASSGRYTHTDGEFHRRVPFDCYKIGGIASGADLKSVTNDYAHDPRVYDQNWARELGLVSFAGYRLLSKDGSPLGVMALFAKHPISSDEAAILEGLANTTPQVVQTAMADEVLRQSEEKYRTIIENIEEGYYEVDLAGNMVSCNESLCKILGYTCAELKGMNNRRYMDPANAKLVFETFNKVYTTGKPVQVTGWELTRKDGIGRSIEASVSPAVDSEGKPRGFTGIVRDVTGRKQVERDLIETQERYKNLYEESRRMQEVYRSLLSSTPDAIVMYDLQGRCQYVNESFVKTFGWTLEDLAEKGVPYTPDSEREATMVHVRNIVDEGGFVSRFETKRSTKDGRLLDISMSASRFNDHEGNPAGMVVILRDISERKLVEKALRESEASYRSIFDSMNDAIFVHDVETGEILDVNRKMCEMFGYTPNEARNLSVGQISSGEPTHSQEEALQRIRRAARGEPQLFEWLCKHSDGRFFWVEANLKRAVVGGQDHVLAVVRDISERKQAEQELRESQERLKLVLKGADLGLWDWNLNTGSAVWNEPAIAILGYSRDEVETNLRFWKGLVHPEDWPKVSEVLNEHLQGRLPFFEAEYRLRSKSGEWKWILARGRVVEHDTDGKPLRMTGTTLDINERKRTEDALRRSEDLQRTILSTSPVGIGLAVERRMVWVNDAWNKIFGFGADDVDYANRSARILYPSQEEFDRVGRVLYRGLEMGQANETDARMIRKDGSIFDAHITIKAIDPSDLSKGTIASIMDITARKEAEERLRESEDRHRNLYVNAPVGVFQAFADGRLLTVNPAYARMFGYESPEHVMTSVKDVARELWVQPEQREKLIEAALGHDGAINVEAEFRRKEGSSFIGNLYFQVIRHEDGSIKFVEGFVEDISERKRSEQERESLRNQLLQAQKMQAIGTLTGGIAHDFNNMLTIILGYSELLLEDFQEGDPRHADLEKIVQTTRNGADLVQRLLTFSRQKDAQPRKMNLNDQIRQISKLLSKTIPKMVEINLILGDDLAPISADPSQMEQIVMNLAVNASEAMPDGGKLTVETRNVLLDEEFCRTHHGAKPGDYVLLRVADTGSGMDKDLVDRMFDPFFTTKGWDSRKGTGLGLPIVQGVVQQHEGRIECFSELGKGTTFDIYWPVMKEDVESREVTGKPTLPGSTETILLVDDEDFIRDLGKRYLNRAGYTVVEARNGTEALELYRKDQKIISLIILDLVMPEMGGKQCIEHLFKINPKVKVLIASGYSSGGTAESGSELGARGFVGKPFDMKQLLKAVRDVLDGD